MDVEEGRQTDLKPSMETLEAGPGQNEPKEICQTVVKWPVKPLKDSVPRLPASTSAVVDYGRLEAGMQTQSWVSCAEARQPPAVVAQDPIAVSGVALTQVD